MTRTLSKILILVLMVGIFFAPVGASFEKKDNQIAFNVEVSTVNAQVGPGLANFWASSSGFDFECNILPGPGSVVGCIAEIIYGAVWWPISLLTSLSAKIMDFFIYYSTNSTSYSGSFVGKAWGAVRDIANIFFIIGLLYVAIETILGIGHNGKKMIASIIVVALLINFSLFFTEVVIDTSNILARVFYNNFQQVDKNDPNKVVTNEPTSISTNLVSIFNPQEIIQKENYTNNVGLFIFITLISAILMAFMIYIFLSVALLFVGRVAGLWVAMVFAPIAFASYTVPFEIPGLGHKKWWSDLLKQSFLAPIFIFFLYVILLFGDALKAIPLDIGKAQNGDANYLDKFIKVIVPFAIIFVLIQQAKKLAVEYSGTIGESFSKAGNFIAGAATGAVIGTYATVGRGTIGRIGNNVANSSWAKRWEANGWGGGQFRKAMGSVGSASFDARAGMKSAGLNAADLGKVKEGGFTKIRAENVKKRQEKAKALEVGEDEKLKQSLNKSEEDLQGLMRSYSDIIETTDKKIAAARENLKDARASGDQTKITIYSTQLDAFKAKKKAIKKGEDMKGKNIQYFDENQVVQYINDDFSNVNAGVDAQGNKRTIQQIEDNEIHHKKQEIQKENRNRKWTYADTTNSGFRNTMTVLGGGSWKGNREAANKIRMEAKIEKGDDHGGGGGASHSSPAPKPAASKPAAAGGSHGGGGH